MLPLMMGIISQQVPKTSEMTLICHRMLREDVLMMMLGSTLAHRQYQHMPLGTVIIFVSLFDDTTST